MSQQASTPGSLRHALDHYRVPLVIAAVGVALSIGGFIMALNSQMVALKNDFIAQGKFQTSLIDSRLTVFQEKMDGLRGVFRAAGEEHLEEARAFAEAVLERIPFKMIGWISKTDVAASFAVKPEDLSFSISLQDVTSTEEVREVLGQTGGKINFILSRPLALPGLDAKDRYVAILAPRMERGRLTGTAFGLISLKELFALSPGEPETSTIYLYDAGKRDRPMHAAGYQPPQTPLLPLDFKTLTARAIFYYVETLRSAQNRWVLLFTPSPTYMMRAIDSWAWIALLSGLAITSLISILTFQQASQQITISRKVEEQTGELADAMRRLQGVLDTVLDGIVTIDDRGRIQSFNPAAERIFGYTAGEVQGKNVNVLMPEPYHAEHDRYLHNYMTGGQPKVIGVGREVQGRHKNGTVFPLELGVSEMRLGHHRAFVGSIRDISERKQSESKVGALIEQLSQSNSELERFAYVASHDLQEPLRMITNFNTLLSKRYADRLDERANEYIRISVEASARMRDMIHDLLEYARVGTEAEQAIAFSTEIEMEHVMQNLHDSITERSAEIVYGHLPMVMGNPLRFVRLMQNLIGNGMKYQPYGQKPQIKVDAVRDGSFWTFSIRDNGIGIKPEYLQQIFEPFKRLHSSVQYSGTGIGLAVCKRIVESWGGKIWVTSTPGEGSRFFFTIPGEGTT